MRSGMTLLEVLVVAGLLAAMAGIFVGGLRGAAGSGPVGPVMTWQWRLRDTARETGGIVLERRGDGWQARTPAGPLDDPLILPPRGCELADAAGRPITTLMIDANGFSEPCSCQVGAIRLAIDRLTGSLAVEPAP